MHTSNGQLTSDSDAKLIQRGQGSLFNIWYWNTWIFNVKKLTSTLTSSVYKNNLKRIMDLNIED